MCGGEEPVVSAPAVLVDNFSSVTPGARCMATCFEKDFATREKGRAKHQNHREVVCLRQSRLVVPSGGVATEGPGFKPALIPCEQADFGGTSAEWGSQQPLAHAEPETVSLAQSQCLGSGV